MRHWPKCVAAQEWLFIPCTRREEAVTAMRKRGAFRCREWGCSGDGFGIFWRQQMSGQCELQHSCAVVASFCSCSSAPVPSFVFIMSSLGSRVKAMGWILALVSVLGSAVVTSALASMGVSDEVPAVALFCFPRHLGLCSRTGKMTKGDFAGRAES